MVATPFLVNAALDSPVAQYFQAFNREDYAAVAALFADQGILYPPFEAGIVGPAAIAQYLKDEARGMQARVVRVECQPLQAGHRQMIAKGRVKTPLFAVNVQWIFELTAGDRIQHAEIKLLASLQDLLNLNRG